MQVTGDNGSNWVKYEKFPGVPDMTMLSDVHASPNDTDTVYAAFNDYLRGNFKPYLLKSTNRGKDWTSIAGDLPQNHSVWSVVEDLVNKNLLFAGTEFGLYASFDGGRKWMRWSNGLPTVAVDDIVIHPRERDLIVATHGRSIYLLDGIQLLEQWNARSLADTVQFAPPRAAWAYYPRTIGGKWGQRDWLGKNPPFGAWFDYFLPRKLDGEVSIAVADSAGHAVRTLSGPGEAGFHRVVWDLVPGEPRDRIRRDEWAGQPQYAAPGVYKVTLTAGKAAPRSRTVEIKAVPGTYPKGL